MDDNTEIFHLEQVPAPDTTPTTTATSTSTTTAVAEKSASSDLPQHAKLNKNRQNDSISDYFIENELIPDEYLMMDDIHNLTDHNNTPSKSCQPVSIGNSLSWMSSSPMLRCLNGQSKRVEQLDEAVIKNQVGEALKDIVETLESTTQVSKTQATTSAAHNGKQIILIVSLLNAIKYTHTQCVVLCFILSYYQINK